MINLKETLFNFFPFSRIVLFLILTYTLLPIQSFIYIRTDLMSSVSSYILVLFILFIKIMLYKRIQLKTFTLYLYSLIINLLLWILFLLYALILLSTFNLNELTVSIAILLVICLLLIYYAIRILHLLLTQFNNNNFVKVFLLSIFILIAPEIVMAFFYRHVLPLYGLDIPYYQILLTTTMYRFNFTPDQEAIIYDLYKLISSDIFLNVTQLIHYYFSKLTEIIFLGILISIFSTQYLERKRNN